MPFPDPQSGLIISDTYRWWDQQDQERDEGVKDRSCVVVLPVRLEEGERLVTVAPITYTPPGNPQNDP